jgi:hypothetical protein
MQAHPGQFQYFTAWGRDWRVERSMISRLRHEIAIRFPNVQSSAYLREVSFQGRRAQTIVGRGRQFMVKTSKAASRTLRQPAIDFVI